MNGRPSYSTVSAKRVTSRVPGGIGKPRSSSSAVMTPRPARWTSVGRIAPVAAGDRQPVVEHRRPAAPRIAVDDVSAASTLDPLAADLEQRARRRIERAHLPLDLLAGSRESSRASALSILAHR